MGIREQLDAIEDTYARRLKVRNRILTVQFGLTLIMWIGLLGLTHTTWWLLWISGVAAIGVLTLMGVDHFWIMPRSQREIRKLIQALKFEQEGGNLDGDYPNPPHTTPQP